ncbi:MAG: SxtJ family membrane protein [Candidatus Eisenbacteria bacterium]
MAFDELSQIKSDRKELRKFGLTVGIAFAALGAFLLWRGRAYYPYFFGLGGALVLLGLVAPGLLKRAHRVWMSLALVLGWVMTRVILSLLFYLAFTPIGLVAKLLGKRFLRPKRDGAEDTYWVRRVPAKPDRTRYEKQF